MKKVNLAAIALAMLLALSFLTGCSSEVPPGSIGRINTRSGWEPAVLKPGYHSCYGKDKLYLLDVTNKTFKEHMNVLVGGKVNLTIDIAVRVRANTNDEELMRKAFEIIIAQEKDGKYWITVDKMYETFLQMKALAVPREVFEIEPDIQTAVANSPTLAAAVRKKITELATSTPLIVDDVQITNYDWPKSITEAQEELVKIQLREQAAAAQVRADLQKAQGDLQVAEANRLVELKKAEAIAGSIDIIKKRLAGAPEYLMWHQIRVMGEAAMGPNNAFILYPYATGTDEVRAMMGNANLSQMLKADPGKAEPSKK